MTGFLYPRTISVTRPGIQPGFGAQGYGGELPSTETSVAMNLPASIQFYRERGANDARLPADVGKTYSRVLIPAAAAANGLIKTRDVLTDDLGQRWTVVQPYWNSLGYNLMVERLET